MLQLKPTIVPEPAREFARIRDEYAKQASDQQSKRPSAIQDTAACTDTCAANCKVHGPGLLTATVREDSVFTIDAFDGRNQRRTTGGDAFFVSIRAMGGAITLRARVADNDDGTCAR